MESFDATVSYQPEGAPEQSRHFNIDAPDITEACGQAVDRFHKQFGFSVPICRVHVRSLFQPLEAVFPA